MKHVTKINAQDKFDSNTKFMFHKMNGAKIRHEDSVEYEKLLCVHGQLVYTQNRNAKTFEKHCMCDGHEMLSKQEMMKQFTKNNVSYML